MNTPKSKKPKRFTGVRSGRVSSPDGNYKSGLWNQQFQIYLAEFIAGWPHLEDKMIDVMRDLLGGDSHLPARQIFRSIISNQARRKVLLALLQKSPINKDKGELYDLLIDQFSDLVSRRNTLLHSLWYTHESGRVFISEESVEDFHLFDWREIELKELEAALNLMWALATKIRNRHNPNWVTVSTSPETLPQPRLVNKKQVRQARRTKDAKP
ncbi:MAG: hypothetical protein WCI56_13930 [Hyphomicrobiales bacterium]